MATKLHRSAHRLSAVLSNVPDGIITADVKGRIQSFNPAAEDIFGYGAGEVLGKPLTVLMPQAYAEAHDQAVKSYVQTGRSKILGVGAREVMGRRKNGDEFALDLATSEMVADGQRFFIAIVRDVTERQHMRTELMDAKRQAERANRAKSDFLSSMSHEVRTPLNAILGFSELLAQGVQGSLSGEQSEYVADIRNAARMLQSIIDGVLDLSNIERGRYVIRPRNIDVFQTVARAAKLAATQEYAQGIGFVSDVPRDLPPVEADGIAVQQIVLNLLSNAFKFTPVGGRVRVRARVDSANGLTLRVSDTGVGMATDDLGKAAEIFSQFDGGFRRRLRGTGVGLPLSRRLAELHQGTLHLASRSGRGTVVTVRIPAKNALETNPNVNH